MDVLGFLTSLQVAHSHWQNPGVACGSVAQVDSQDQQEPMKCGGLREGVEALPHPFLEALPDCSSPPQCFLQGTAPVSGPTHSPAAFS